MDGIVFLEEPRVAARMGLSIPSGLSRQRQRRLQSTSRAVVHVGWVRYAPSTGHRPMIRS